MVRATVAFVVRVWTGKRCRLPSMTHTAGLHQDSPDEKKASATAFLERALGLFETHGITIERVMTDNGGACKNHLFR